jgi:phosphatidylinositol alpha-1,6-mannosyltransferase
VVVPVYPKPGGYAPGLRQNMHAMAHLLVQRQAQLWHFVFAPNPRTSSALAPLCKLRGMRTVQTIASPPRQFEGVGKLLFGKIVVAQSEWTRERVVAAAPEREIRVIRPPLGSLITPSLEQLADYRQRLNLRPDQRVLVYPGDLEFSGGAQRVARAVPELVAQIPGAVVVFACRQKTAKAREVDAELRASLNPEHVRFAGELPSLLPLLALADAVLFPVEDLWAKVDIPIAALETMALGVPLVRLDTGPLAELVGPLAVPKDDTLQLVEAAKVAVLDPSRRAEIISVQKQNIAEVFDAKVVAAQYEQLYDELA